MKFYKKVKEEIRLDLIDKYSYYIKTGVELKLEFPHEIEILDNLYIYENKNEKIIDYKPEDIGYYWNNGNLALRTTEGLKYKDCEQDGDISILKNGELISQELDWCNSFPPKDKNVYIIKNIKNKKAYLIQENDEFYLMIDNQKYLIRVFEISFIIKKEYETGYEKIKDQIFYYGREVRGCNRDQFSVLHYNYGKDDQNIYFTDKLIKDADIKSFIPLTMSIAKDKNHVFFSEKVMLDIDVNSYTIIDCEDKNAYQLYSKDKNSVYIYSEIIMGADSDSFEIIYSTLSKDKNFVYISGKRVKKIDANSVYYANHKYIGDKNGIYKIFNGLEKVTDTPKEFKDFGYGYFAIGEKIYQDSLQYKLDADYSSFLVINEVWSKDDKNIFYDGEIIYSGCTEKVELIDDEYLLIDDIILTSWGVVENANTKSWINLIDNFYQSNDCLFYKNRLIENGDINSFKKLRNTYYMDKNQFYIVYDYSGEFYKIEKKEDSHIDLSYAEYVIIDDKIYFCGREIIGADVDSFVDLEYSYSKDKNSVYYGERVLSGLNPKKIKALNYQFITDNETTYYGANKIEIFGDNIELIDDNHIKDIRNVYYRDIKIEDCKPDSFQVEMFYSFDKKNVYYDGRNIGKRMNDFIIIDGVYLINNNKVYHINNEIKNVDVENFFVIGDNISRDNNKVFYREYQIKDADPFSFKIMGYCQYEDKNALYFMENGKVIREPK